MRVIGLTGGIACGKSTVSDYLRRQPGCTVIDGDLLSRSLTSDGGAAIPAIRSTFGRQVFLSDGSLDRRRLGTLVFSDPKSRETLDRLMAPFLSEATDLALQRARDEGAELCFLDYPLLFEKGYDRLCDSVWCVWIPEPLQLQRLMNRDGFSEEEARARIRASLSSDEKAARSSTVIDNTGSVSYTLSRIPALIESEKQKAVPPPRRRRTDRYNDDYAPHDVSSSPSWQQHSSPPPRLAAEEPEIMLRPEGAYRKPSKRKVAWRIPSALLIALISAFLLTAAAFTVRVTTNAYLVSRKEEHKREQQAILDQYPLPRDYRTTIEHYAALYNLDPAFVSSVIRNESSFRPDAESNVGARGLMQLMPSTAEWVAGKLKFSDYSFDRMWDPYTNIFFGCWYLNYLSTLFNGDTVCVICAYHAGQGEVAAWLMDPLVSRDGVTLSLDRLVDGPTKIYAGRVTRAYGIYKTLYYSPDIAADLSDPDMPV